MRFLNKNSLWTLFSNVCGLKRWSFFLNFKRSCLVILFCQWAGLDSSTLALSCYEFSDVCLWITGDSLWKWKHQRQFKALFSIRALFVLEFISRDPVCASVMWGHQSGQKLPPETNLILFIASCFNLLIHFTSVQVYEKLIHDWILFLT